MQAGDLDAMAEIIERTPENFTLYSGDDSITLPLLSIGGTGVISVASHIIGNEMKAMIADFKAGNLQEAATAHRQLLPVFKGLFTAPNPTPVKAALHLKGIPVGGVRLPLVPLNEEEIETLQKPLEKQTSSC